MKSKNLKHFNLAVGERKENESQFIFERKMLFEALPRKIIQPKLDEIYKNTDKEESKWKLNVDEIEQLLHRIKIKPETSKKLVMVIDLKPNSRSKEISLFQIENIFGYSYKDWTPLCLELRIVYDRADVQNFEDQKKTITVKKSDFQKRIYEFLYIRKGLKSGTLNWGMTGSVNAVLLWPETLKYFLNECVEISE